MEEDVTPCDATQVNLVFFGPAGCGKSTTVGHLIADCGAIDEQSLGRIARDAAEAGEENRRYAWILDKLRCERERGGTMFQALWRLRSQRCQFTIIDAPGHDDFTKDIVTAMSQADIAVLVVDALQGGANGGTGSEVQIREHTLLAYTLGLRQIVVCINKMDHDGVAYSYDHFARACMSVREDLEDVGLKTHDMHFVPISGLIGDNVAYRTESMAWYAGPTLLEAMDDAVASHFKPEYPLRLPVHDVMQIGGQGVVAVGRVATGSLHAGMDLVFQPGDMHAKVLSIRKHHETLNVAFSGDTVNVAVDMPPKELRRGMVGSATEDSPASECSSFIARVIVLPHDVGRERTSREITKDCTLWVECHTAQVPCKFEELLSRTDRRSGKVLEVNPVTLHAGDAAVVRLRPEAPLCVESFSEYPPLGRFAVRDQKTTVAVGVVQQVDVVAEMPEWQWALSVPSSLPRSPGYRSKLHTSKGMKGHSRLSDKKSKPPGRSSPLGISRLPVVDDSGEEVAEDSPRESKQELDLRCNISTKRNKPLDSGDDSPDSPAASKSTGRPGGFAASSTPSPFLAFGAAKNMSPFAAFGAVTKKRVKEQSTEYPRCVREDGTDGTGESDS